MITAGTMRRERAFTAVLVALVHGGCGVPLSTGTVPSTAAAVLLSLQFNAGTTLHYGLSASSDNVTGIGAQPQQFPDAVSGSGHCQAIVARWLQPRRSA
jgi:hypothetical protein